MDGKISTIAGNGTSGFSGDDGPASSAQLYYPRGVVVAGDGTLYIADTYNNRIRRVGVDGKISTVAGNGTGGFGGDSGPASSAQLYFPSGVVVAGDGTLYIADSRNRRVRRVGVDGKISTVAGNGSDGFSGDGDPASSAQLSFPNGVAVAGDGTLYIADTYNNRIRRVGVDGKISTVAGNGTSGFSGDGGPASSAQLSSPSGVAVAGDGTLYIADTFNSRIRRVGVDGKISTVAGNGTSDFSGDGGPL